MPETIAGHGDSSGGLKRKRCRQGGCGQIDAPGHWQSERLTVKQGGSSYGNFQFCELETASVSWIERW